MEKQPENLYDLIKGRNQRDYSQQRKFKQKKFTTSASKSLCKVIKHLALGVCCEMDHISSAVCCLLHDFSTQVPE